MLCDTDLTLPVAIGQALFFYSNNIDNLLENARIILFFIPSILEKSKTMI